MNLFIVSSPFQYICALEAKNKFNCTDNILLIIDEKHSKGIKQLNSLLKDSDWDHQYHIDRKRLRTELPKVINKIKKELSVKNITNFFYTDYNAWWIKPLRANFNIDKEIYFDDGTLTILDYYKYITKNISTYRKGWLQDLILIINKCKPVLSPSTPKNLELFSFFHLDPDKYIIHNNNFNHLKKHYNIDNLYDKDAPIGFIGQGAIGSKGHLNIDEYITLIKNTFKKENKKIIYFPHRNEQKELTEIIKGMNFISYHNSDNPLEIELHIKKIKLSKLIGSLSTVMFTIRNFDNNIPIYAIQYQHPDNIFMSKIKEELHINNIKKMII